MPTISVVVSIIALVVSAIALLNSMRQRKIASEAHRLNLYLRRFSVFDKTISFYTRFSQDHPKNRWNRTTYEKEALAFKSNVNEAVFLFKPEDKIPELMESFLGKTDLFNKSLIDFGNALDEEIIEIRKKVDPYLNFHQISVDDEKGAFDQARSWIEGKWRSIRGRSF